MARRVIKQYEFLRKIGSGGSGVVFLANDRGIKFLRIVGFRTQGVADRAANLTMILPLP